MKISILEEPRTIISNPGSKHNYFAWPSVGRLPDGRIAAVCSGFRVAHVCPFGKSVMAVSEDGGKTYSSPFPIIDTALDDRDSGFMTFGEKGVIITSFNNTRLAQRNWHPLEPDGDRELYLKNLYIHAYLDTVTDEEEARDLGSTFRMSADGGKTYSPVMKSPVTSPHGPCELQDGTILYVGRIFSPDDSVNDDRVQAWRINPDGSMEHLGTVPPIYKDGRFQLSCEPHAIQLPNGRIICHIRVEPQVFTVYQSVSDDGGRTWSTPVPLLADRGGSPPHLLRHSSGTLISTYGYREAPYGIRVMFSTDNGETWDTDNILWDKGLSHDLGYPCTMELEDGSLLTVFYTHETGSKEYSDPGVGATVIKQMLWKIED